MLSVGSARSWPFRLRMMSFMELRLDTDANCFVFTILSCDKNGKCVNARRTKKNLKTNFVGVI